MKRWVKVALLVTGGMLLVAVGLIGWLYWQVRASLPLLEGEFTLPGLSDRVTVERDALGVPTIRAEGREDLARALGFIHAQERFFQMDLMRRQAAGELSELIGAGVLEIDRASRIHRFRARASGAIGQLPSEKRQILEAYVDGVNSGLQSLGQLPFEYLLMRLKPEPWKPEDTFLVLYAMFFVLNDERGRGESNLGLLYDLFPKEIADFLAPSGTNWDAPLIGEPRDPVAIPGPDIFSLRSGSDSQAAGARLMDEKAYFMAGSNNWAVAGSKTRDGRAILADDMHLDIRVPNTWYRAMFQWPGNKSSNQVIGVTLPGTPVVVVGSNSRVAWGFTNTGGDWVDLIILEIDPSNPDRYLTPDGYRSFEVVVETIKVKGGDSHEFEIRETIWGPVIDEDHQGRPRALRWIAHEPGGVNFEHLDLEQAASVQEAVEIANRSGIPPQNFVCADTEGNIAWTVEGRIPRRVGFSGRLPSSWADGAKYWDGWLDPAEYPRIVNPVSGIIWTANARVVDGEMLAKMGDGGYVLGSRAKQIRDSLKFLSDAKESDMLEIQLDDRAVFLEPWQKLILQLLNQEAIELDPRRAEFRALVEETWTGRASIESVSYRLVRAFRQTTIEQVLGWVVDRCGDADPQFSLYSLQQREAPVWSLLTKRPAHLLDPQFDSWREALLSNVDSVISYFNTQAGGLRERSWGELNTSRIQHPLSRALPILSSLLDMPAESLPGDDNMPRVQSPSNGASERFAVSPGHEDDAYFQMPGGQSGHPLSPYYRAGHENWREGRLASFLPGAPEKILDLKP